MLSVAPKNKDANQWTETWHWIIPQRKPNHFEAGSVGEWSWLRPCSPSSVIWHVQRSALLQALRHWSKERALTGSGNKNRNKGTNDFVPAPVWCLPLAHHGLSAYCLRPDASLSRFLHNFLPPLQPHPPITLPVVRFNKTNYFPQTNVVFVSVRQPHQRYHPDVFILLF